MKRLRLSEAKEGTQILSKRQSQYLTPDLSDPKVQAPSTTPSFFPDSKGLGSFPQLPASGRVTLVAPTTLDPSPEAEGWRSRCQWMESQAGGADIGFQLIIISPSF